MEKKLYQPALLPRQIRALYKLKKRSGKPMTFHARRALDDYLARFPEIFRGDQAKDERGTRADQ